MTLSAIGKMDLAKLTKDSLDKRNNKYEVRTTSDASQSSRIEETSVFAGHIYWSLAYVPFTESWNGR